VQYTSENVTRSYLVELCNYDLERIRENTISTSRQLDRPTNQ